MAIRITFSRPIAFDPTGGGDWVSAILGDPTHYTVLTSSTAELVLSATAASGYAGYRVVLTPAMGFATWQSGVYPPVSGQVSEVALYDSNGLLVCVIDNIPASASSFGQIANYQTLGAGGAIITGSDGADTLGGYNGVTNYLYGEAGNDQVRGGSGPDLIEGGEGADTLNGGSGNDYIIDGVGDDSIDAGLGNDLVVLDNGAAALTVYLNQAAPSGIRVDNAEWLYLGNGANTVYGGALSEGVWGGTSADRLEGNGGNDYLIGDAGADSLIGGAGNDWLEGDRGADLLDGGSGFDIVDYDYSEDVITVDLRISAAQQTGEGLDTLIGIEGVWGSEFNDTLTGNSDANWLFGDEGDDLLDGGDGDDELSGGIGADQVFGSLGADSITDSAGRNFLRGGAGDDLIRGGANFDDAHGNEGNDTVYGGTDDDWVVGGKDHDQLYGEDGGDIVLGNLGDDTCEGGAGNDVVRGGQANDVVRGDAGADWLSGDRGDDTITGGLGADTFHCFAEAGVDRVMDFNAAEGDRVNLLPGSTYAVAQVGADTVITVGGDAQMVLIGVTLSTLPEGWIYIG